jgi:hypothetical protein
MSKQGPVNYETQMAIYEGHRNKSEDAYFAARPAHDHDLSRLFFRHGFDRGYQANAHPTPEVVQGLVEALEYINGLALANEPRDLKTIAQTSAKALAAYKEAK